MFWHTLWIYAYVHVILRNNKHGKLTMFFKWIIKVWKFVLKVVICFNNNDNWYKTSAYEQFSIAYKNKEKKVLRILGIKYLHEWTLSNNKWK